MDSFYLIVLSVAAVLLIITLTYIGIKMTTTIKQSTIFPPNYSECPDYWTMTNDLTACVIPKYGAGAKNIGKIYDANGSNALTNKNTYGLSTNKQNINFNDMDWNKNGQSSVCAHKSWARANGILWDGISNYNSC